MKALYALYDRSDNLIDCSFLLKQLLDKKTKHDQIIKIRLEPKQDIFNEEDIKFIEEYKNNCFTNKELAQIYGVSERTIYRRMR